MNIYFLSVNDIIAIHNVQIKRYGGLAGIRDLKLLESACFSVQASWDGKFLHSDIASMAGAYAYGIIKNHPFLDGNKRTGILSSLLFLDINDYGIKMTLKEYYLLPLEIAKSKMTLDEVINFFRVRLNSNIAKEEAEY